MYTIYTKKNKIYTNNIIRGYKGRERDNKYIMRVFIFLIFTKKVNFFYCNVIIEKFDCTCDPRHIPK